MKTRWIWSLIAIVLLLAGGVWTFQGIGMIHGSYMTGRSEWMRNGIVTMTVGIALLIWANVQRRKSGS